MGSVSIHSHALKHGVREQDILWAWSNFVRKQHRQAPNNDQILAIGFDRTGRLVQMVGIVKPFGVLIYHAMTPPTEKAFNELKIKRR